ncbi:M23 family metallopeptidase [Streptomyces anulatus]|uniref:M23 family metallopeptidase n=1 Tax=Streptomyces anulatus TaxID=1892 RepID=UPI001F37CFB2|nr:M23 family metallopeptidase [Streptomyces anulatus]
MDDRHASEGWVPAVPLSGTTHAAWQENPRWEVPHEPHGRPNHDPGQHHAGYTDTDPLFGAMPGTYGISAPDDGPFVHRTWHEESGGHDTAKAWEISDCRTGPSGYWYAGQWADPIGPAFSPTIPDSSDALGPDDGAALVDFHDGPEEEPLGRAPTYDAPGSAQDTSAASSAPSTSPDRPATRRADGRGRGRRAPRRGSAFLTVVAPSVAFVGMAGMAAASIGLGDDVEAVEAADDPAVEPSAANSEFDTQLTTLSSGADDFAERASRTQERVDLEQQRLEEQKRRKAEAKRKKAEAARKEALRPKFVLPVAQKGVGELFGAAGAMWSNRHTGLDFPVPMNTPVMAVTDGTVEAVWNTSYGNLVKVTAPDGTQTWYAHLAGFRIRSGFVKAGTVIAYAGSTGNSSGPHLHLEVHPGGGDAIDPLAWLRSHGLDPT